MNAYEFLSKDNFITINKTVAKKIGITGTALLSELCYRRQYLERSGKLSEDGYFYATIHSIQEELPLSEYEQKKILDNLEELGVVTVERRGIPAKRYIYIHEDALINLLSTAQSPSEQVSKNLGNKNPKNLSQINNNITNNISHISSKDDILDKGCSTRPKTSVTSSGKLFSSEKPKTKKSSIQKTNNFITACQKEAVKKEFPSEVLSELDKYFRMLAEMNCLLPAVSIAEQLTHLLKVPADKQVEVIKNTISRGWKSLQYEADSVQVNSRPSWDTAEPGTFEATPEEDKNGDWKKDIPEEHIF